MTKGENDILDLDNLAPSPDITVPTSQGDVSLRGLDIDDMSETQKIINDAELDDRQAVIALLAHQQTSTYDLSLLGDEDLRRIVVEYARFEHSIFGNITDTDDSYSHFRTALTDYYKRMIDGAIRIIQPTIEPLRHMMTEFTKQIAGIQSIFEPIAKIVADLQKVVQPLMKLVGGVSAHFPSNWPIAQRVACAKLCEQGLPIVFVPSAAIISKLLVAKTPAAQKRVLIRHDIEILKDCRDKLSSHEVISNEMIDHITASVDAYESGNYRAAQSAATIAFDSLMPIIYDMRVTYKRDRTKLAASFVRKLASDLATDILQHPLAAQTMFYSVACLPVVARALSQFQIGDRSTYAKDFNRHASAHTVSAQQYKRSNALIAIMTVTSLCIVTEKSGKYWLSAIAQFYEKP